MSGPSRNEGTLRAARRWRRAPPSSPAIAEPRPLEELSDVVDDEIPVHVFDTDAATSAALEQFVVPESTRTGALPDVRVRGHAPESAAERLSTPTGCAYVDALN
jgi:hypothetical protein